MFFWGSSVSGIFLCLLIPAALSKVAAPGSKADIVSSGYGERRALEDGNRILRCSLGEPSSLSDSQPPPVQLSLEDGQGPEHLALGNTGTASASDVLAEMRLALRDMQSHFFSIYLGTWPTSIDWTAAVMATYVAGALSSLGASLTPRHTDDRTVANEINKYFSQTVQFYFGENTFALRNEAYDDMLWVVLDWLQDVKFIDEQTDRQRNWYGTQFRNIFAHRAHVFYDLASRGWDTRLCGGGMIWNPRLTPYKNAVTNELFISASTAMYLYFPGDKNCSPYSSSEGSEHNVVVLPQDTLNGIPSVNLKDPKYLYAAIGAYDWLRKSNMTNHRGLYVDGFHISNLGDGGVACDKRNEMVYTYNQGVLLSGLRGMYLATGNVTYIEDGHALIRAVVEATGFDLDGGTPRPGRYWRGLGRAGILEEICDASGTCSQDGQTFKGIFFHHFTRFCAPLPQWLSPPVDGKFPSFPRERALHKQSCRSYMSWVRRNAVAAQKTRDERGLFGMWWGVALWNEEEKPEELASRMPDGAVDHLNEETEPEDQAQQKYRTGRDANDRGRGRTLETQGGGLSVLRALYELEKQIGGHR